MARREEKDVLLRRWAPLACLPLLAAAVAYGTIFANVRGVVHDTGHRPISGASVELRSTTSQFQKMLTTGPDGSFEQGALPLGEYRVHVSASGFAPEEQVFLLKNW